MIKELTSENIFLIDNSFLDKEKIMHELKVNPFAKIIVYIKNNTVIAYLYYSDIYDRIEINQIEVDLIHRNCGIGTKLMEKLIENVDKNMTLEVKKDNIVAISLYKKFNFVEKAIRKGYYSGVDGILMERVVK